MQAMSAPPGGRTRPGKRDNGVVSPAVRPRWIVLSIFVTVFTVTCVVLGFWQLGRLEERRASNAVVGSRLARAPVGLALLREALLPQEGAATDPSYYEFTRVTAEGRLSDEGRVLVRSQVAAGQAGTHAVFPLDLGDGAAVLVNVGWFPLGVEPAPAADLYPPSGQMTLVGLLRADQRRPAFGRREPEGLLETVSRVDVGRIQEQVDIPLLPFWIQLVEPDDPDRFPIPAPIPSLDEGSHLSYAVQWFSFGATALAVYLALMRKEIRPGSRLRRRRAQPPDPRPR